MASALNSFMYFVDSFLKNPSELEQAVIKRDEAAVQKLLNSGANLNKNNLLARLVMCRLPINLHVDLQDSNEDGRVEKIDLVTGYKIKKIAAILIKGGAQLDKETVDEFLSYQKKLEDQLTQIWAKHQTLSEREKFGQGIDPGRKAFTNLAHSYNYAGTSNPYIQIINNETNSPTLISDNEREVCRFASVILPQLLEGKTEEESKKT